MLEMFGVSIAHGASQDWGVLVSKIAYLDTTEAHTYRIAAMIKSLREGWIPEPLLFGLDGRLWDGHHRLCALRFHGTLTHSVVDFSWMFLPFFNDNVKR
jgi:hypothetical protein